LRVPFAVGFEVLAQEAEKIAGLAQFGVQIGKLLFLAEDEFVVEHQSTPWPGQAFRRMPPGIRPGGAAKVLHRLGLEKGGFGVVSSGSEFIR
jgi:hypothetical protein